MSSYPSKVPQRSRKSLLKAYFCWLVGGIFGLHHFYLERDKHAFITFATFGGYFSLGVIRDLWRLPEYVKEANDDRDYVKKLKSEMKRNPRPTSSYVRQGGRMMLGNYFAYLIEYSIPTELLNDKLIVILKFLLIPLGSATGVWLAGNVGHHQGPIKGPLIAAYIAAIPSTLFDIQYGSLSTLASTIVFNKYSLRWRTRREPTKAFCKRVAILSFYVLLFLSLWSSWLYFGCTVEDPDTKEPIKCRIALQNFINSPAYTNLSEATWILVEHVRSQGFMGLWREIMQEFDVSGKTTALAILELKEDASPQEILAKYKKLSREFHPDREKDMSKKAEKHEKFIQVQEAFRKLESKVQRYKIQEEQTFSSSREEL